MQPNDYLLSFESLLTKSLNRRTRFAHFDRNDKSTALIIGELLKEERKLANLTQEELGNRIGAKKSYISRIENGKTDIQLSTLFKLFEEGLGKRVEIGLSNRETQPAIDDQF